MEKYCTYKTNRRPTTRAAEVRPPEMTALTDTRVVSTFGDGMPTKSLLVFIQVNFKRFRKSLKYQNGSLALEKGPGKERKMG